MIAARRSDERGRARLDWLDSRHTFSFGEYHDPAHMGFRTLRVINEDRVEPGRGFATHSHRDMEILSYVLDGALEHRDSMGNGSVILPGDVQLMRAGTGVTHSEFNPSPAEPAHFLQIWILPEQKGLEPAYAQRSVPAADGRTGFVLVASRDGRHDSLLVRQDADVYVARPQAGTSLSHALAPGRHAWVQVARGSVGLNGLRLEAGDGAALSGERHVEIVAHADAELLLFDLA